MRIEEWNDFREKRSLGNVNLSCHWIDPTTESNSTSEAEEMDRAKLCLSETSGTSAASIPAGTSGLAASHQPGTG